MQQVKGPVRVFHTDQNSCCPQELCDAMFGHNLNGVSHLERCTRLWNKGGYIFVGYVQTDDLDEAFELTNAIDCPWQENEKVSAMPGRQRSSSVGDILMDDDGQAWLVASFGFEKMDEGVRV